tara:strand:- start:1202 stop:1939 length:738 start_codon:yes stop_codon:yes gene_type:complete
MMEENDYLLFEDYIEETMSDAAKLSFERRLKTDAPFLESFNLYKEATHHFKNRFAKEEETLAFKNSLNATATEYFKNQSPKVIKFEPWKYATAACLLLFSGLFFYFNSISGIPTYKDLNTISEINIVERSTNTTVLKKAEEAYNTQSFNEAKIYFEQILAKDTTNSELLFYKAIAQLELSEYMEAENSLTRLSKGTSVYANEALWYLALSKLKQKEYDSCKMILNTIPASADTYSKAQKLVKVLE